MNDSQTEGKKPLTDGGSIDTEIAADLARSGLCEALKPPAVSGRSDVARLTELTSAIWSSLENKETPTSGDLEEARFWLEELEQRLDEVAALHSIHPWNTGVPWSELTDAQQAELEERCELDRS